MSTLVAARPTMALTVRSGSWQETFEPGPDLVIGRDPQADIRLPHPGVSRTHIRLRFRDGRWTAIDARSFNGMFIGNRRIHSLDLNGGETINIGAPDGPPITFELAAPTSGRTDMVTVTSMPTVDFKLLRTPPVVTFGGLEVRNVSLTVGDGVTALDRVSLSARPGTLTAVIGPSGAGKSTLSKVVVGLTRPTTGSVTFDGLDVHSADLRDRIGMVPQDDVVHGRLTVAQALRFAAELRMPPTATAQDREQTIARVLAELELTAHADTRVDRLSGGQRKRVSVAMELLTSPALLVLDEPTTGLDPALDRQVMAMLRRLAEAGRVVVVVTHSLAFLDVCHQVLLLAPGGKIAFCGPPSSIGPTLGTTDWAELFTRVAADPEGAQRFFFIRRGPETEPTAPAPAEQPWLVGQPKPDRAGGWRQFSTVARRQVRLLVANRGYFVFLMLLPFVVGLLPLTVVGDAGFGMPPADGSAPFEPRHVTALLNFAAVLMGITLTVRDLVGERAIFQREQAMGLSASAYLAAKIAVFGTVATFQAGVLVLIVTAPVIGKPLPPSATVLGNPLLELFIGVAGTCVTVTILGLMVSALARSGDQVIVLLAAALAAQLVLAGGFIPVTGRPLLETVAALTPARWGFSATASTADLTNLIVGIAKDSHWSHTPSAWLFDVAMLAVLALVFAAIARWRLRIR